MKKRDLTKDSVVKSLLVVAIPTMLSQLLIFSYNIVDLKFISGLGTSAIAAVGSATLFVGIGFSLNALCVVGTGIKASQASGRNDVNAFHNVMNIGHIINIAVNVIFALLLFTFSEFLISLLKIKDPKAIMLAVQYLRILSVVSFFQHTNQMISRVLGSLGLSDKTLYISLVGVIINVILDPIFIYTFNWGVQGAAFASLIGNVVMTILFFVFFYSTIKYTKSNKVKLKDIVGVLKLGIPYMSQRFFFTAIGIYMGRLTAEFGVNAIASQRIGIQVESITFMIIGGLFAATSAFAGQNLGACEYDRVRKGYNNAVKIGICYASVTSLLFIIFAPNIARLFDDNTQTVLYTSYYLRVIAFAQVFAVLEMVGNGLYTGIGKPEIPARISIVLTSLRVPIALILSSIIGVIGIFISVAFTSILKGAVSYGIYRFKIRKQIGVEIISTR